ncbi:MAG: threonine/serine dehydratase [Pseudomonadota bacterium]
MNPWFDELPERITAARHRLAPHILETPVSRAWWLEATEDDGAAPAEVWLKCEHLQHTGSFKFRGALNRLMALAPEEHARGVIAASTGNHGQGIARAARILGIAATVYVPETAAPVKLAPMRALGAEVVTVPGDGLAAELEGRRAAAADGRVFVSPYNDPIVVAGQGTIGLELAEQLPTLDALFVSVGGGGLISGIGAALKAANPELKLIGCWPENAPAMARCLNAGQIHEVAESATLSDGTAGGVEADAITFQSCQALIDEQRFVSEVEIAAALARLAREERWIVEGSAGVALAAFLADRTAYARQRVAVVLCGRNIGFEKFLAAISAADT